MPRSAKYVKVLQCAKRQALAKNLAIHAHFISASAKQHQPPRAVPRNFRRPGSCCREQGLKFAGASGSAAAVVYWRLAGDA